MAAVWIKGACKSMAGRVAKDVTFLQVCVLLVQKMFEKLISHCLPCVAHDDNEHNHADFSKTHPKVSFLQPQWALLWSLTAVQCVRFSGVRQQQTRQRGKSHFYALWFKLLFLFSKEH